MSPHSPPRASRTGRSWCEPKSSFRSRCLGRPGKSHVPRSFPEKLLQRLNLHGCKLALVPLFGLQEFQFLILLEVNILQGFLGFSLLDDGLLDCFKFFRCAPHLAKVVPNQNQRRHQDDGGGDPDGPFLHGFSDFSSSSRRSMISQNTHTLSHSQIGSARVAHPQSTCMPSTCLFSLSRVL